MPGWVGGRRQSESKNGPCLSLNSPWSMTEKRHVPFGARGRHPQWKEHLISHVCKKISAGGLFYHGTQKGPAMRSVQECLPCERGIKRMTNWRELQTPFLKLPTVTLFMIISALFTLRTNRPRSSFPQPNLALPFLTNCSSVKKAMTLTISAAPSRDDWQSSLTKYLS